MTSNLSGKTLLLGVGAQKSGTSWLSTYLTAHPQVLFSPVKEMHFWGNRDSDGQWPNSAFERRLDRIKKQNLTGNGTPRFALQAALEERLEMGGDIQKYRDYFDKRVTDEPVFSENSPAYCKLPAKELAVIKEHFDKVKVIFLLRNPADRFWSQMRFSEDVETLEELEKLVESSLTKKVYKDRYDYVTTLRTLRYSFDPAELHFEFYENLFSPEAVQKICDFAEIDYVGADFSVRKNVSIKMPLHPDLRVKIIAKLAQQYTYVRDLFDGNVPKSWKTDLKTLGASN